MIRSQLFSAVEAGTPRPPERVLAVIPARLGSTRMERKMLRTLAGGPMLTWVYRAVRRCAQLDQVLIATDADEIMELAQREGFPAIFTPSDCASGTDRVQVVAEAIPADIYVNVQGDEPLIRPEHIEALLAPFAADPLLQVGTLAVPCAPEQVASPHAVKVVRRADGQALYFSRAAIPFDRDANGYNGYLKHLGIYAYRRRTLERFPALPPSQLEAVEKLEQLRFLENGIGVHVAITPWDTRGVDTEQDLIEVERLLLEGAALRATA